MMEGNAGKLINLFVIGPFMLYVARQQTNPYFKAGLSIAGSRVIAQNISVVIKSTIPVK